MNAKTQTTGMKWKAVVSFATLSVLGMALTVAGCGGAQAPNDHMAQSVAAIRAAEEAGARNEPKGELHLKLAEEQLEEAKQAMSDGEHAQAELLLLRTDADAELALSIARYATEKAEAQKAYEDSDAIKREANEDPY